jgi:hypothetical protein
VDSLVFRLTLLVMGGFAITYPPVAADLGFREPAANARQGANHGSLQRGFRHYDVPASRPHACGTSLQLAKSFSPLPFARTVSNATAIWTPSRANPSTGLWPLRPGIYLTAGTSS